jgi:hypothetical protein
MGMTLGLNGDTAGRLDEVAQILTEQPLSRHLRRLARGPMCLLCRLRVKNVTLTEVVC